MIFDFIKKLFRKKDSIESYKYHTFLEKKHMTHLPIVVSVAKKYNIDIFPSSFKENKNLK